MALSRHYNSTIIIGNGFDKNCGLKTGYKDVYEEYVKSPSSNSNISDFKKNISDNYENWSDFELGMADYAKTFDTEEPFIECLYDFNSFMHQYLRGVQGAFFDSWNSITQHPNVIGEFKNSIKLLGRGITHNVNNLLDEWNIPNTESLGVITFNYTEVFDMLLQFTFGASPHLNPIHVHGKLGDDPILGVDREGQLGVKFKITDKVRRSFLKPVFNQEYDSERVRDAVDLINMSRVIFVFGASLGESDLSWRESLGNWLIRDNDNHLILYDYNNSKRTFLTTQERLNYEIEQKRILLSSWGLESEGDVLKQLHLPCNNIFNIKASVEVDLQEQIREKIVGID